MPEYNMAQTPGLFEQHKDSQKLVWMSPTKFLHMVPPTEYSAENIKNLKGLIESGEELDPLFVDINPQCETTNHEGRHRAKAAQELGVEKVPVILYCRDGRTFLPAKECDCNV